MLLNLVKSDEDKATGNIKEVDEAKATMRALVSDNSGVSVRRKSKTKVLLRVLESRRRSQL
ncbi:hypothetical protein MUK42_06709 [Musa troglodytarum]|uniref:Uncharacterized protein n=1 Tax=Musa troglodytarum TaxID=320322 RepID=A0A9E7HAR1_9LILI|nr:hypothetical protein MUK42_06709 [Musa troglodytarum]